MQQAIGVFDSGIGGLSTLSHIRQLLPSEKLIYLADSAHIPYGCKSEEEVAERCLKISDFLTKKKDVKAIVVACNTATAASICSIREKHGIPVIGMEPPIKPAVVISHSGIIGILTTSGTASSERFNRLQERFSTDVQFLVQPCPGLVECIECGDLGGARVRSMLETYLTPLLEQGVDTLVLGCTHYPLVKSIISEIVGDAIKILDTGDAVACELKRQLMLRGLLAETGNSYPVHFCSSGKMDGTLVSQLWGESVHVELLDI